MTALELRRQLYSGDALSDEQLLEAGELLTELLAQPRRFKILKDIVRLELDRLTALKGDRDGRKSVADPRGG